MTGSTVRDRLVPLLTPLLDGMRLDLEDVEVRAAGRRSVLRVVVDRDDGVTLDQIADVTRAVSRALDESDAMGQGSYTLEVSSPGVDRPLTQPRHWRRNRGRLVRVTRAGAPTVTGRVGEADDDGVDLDVDGTPVRIGYADVTVAKVQVEFGRLDRTPDADVDGDTADDGDADVDGNTADDGEVTTWTST